MSIHVLRGESDGIIERMIETLRAYEADHPDARIDLYRQDCVSVRIRIIDPDFAGVGKVDRHKQAWKYLDRLPEEAQADLSSLTLLAPDEASRSFANMEFEDPIPSTI